MDAPRHRFAIDLPFDEFRVWSQRMRPMLEEARIEAPVIEVLEYVCTEMLNNVLDHSGGRAAEVALDWDAQSVVVEIGDDGRGIFASLRTALGAESDADAAMLLLKGKVTTDPDRHTGEGLFFSARVCEGFELQSGSTGLRLTGSTHPWSFETAEPPVQGTRLSFRVSRSAPSRLREVFDRFCPQPELQFSRTEVSVGLMQQAEGALVSRSQGKRLVMGLERFSAVTLDFTGVQGIRQGFADEVFRVWANAHPAIELDVVCAGEEVVRMLRHVGFDAA